MGGTLILYRGGIQALRNFSQNIRYIQERSKVDSCIGHKVVVGCVFSCHLRNIVNMFQKRGSYG